MCGTCKKRTSETIFHAGMLEAALTHPLRIPRHQMVASAQHHPLHDRTGLMLSIDSFLRSVMKLYALLFARLHGNLERTRGPRQTQGKMEGPQAG